MEKSGLTFRIFLKKNNYALVLSLCFVLALLNLYVSDYFSYIYLMLIITCSMFYDVNKMTILCLVSIFGIQSLRVPGLIQFALSYTIICIKKIIFNKQKFDKTFIFPFMVLICITMQFFCVNFELNNWKTIAQVVLPIFLSIEVYFLRKDFKVDKIIKHSVYLLIFMCIASFMTLLIKTSNVEIIYRDAVGVDRFRGFTSHENSLAVFAILYMAFYLVLFFKRKICAIEFYLIEFILAVLGLATKSKMFLVLLVLLLICYFIKEFQRGRKTALKQLLAFAVFICIFGLLFYSKFEEIFNRFTDYFNEGSFFDMITTGRISIWKHYINLWCESPLKIIFGIGGSYQDAYINYSHNQYLEVLCKYGVVGFSLIFLLIIYFMLITKRQFKCKLENYLPMICIALVCTMGLLDSSLAGIILLVLSSFCINYMGNPPKKEYENKIPKIIHYVWFGGKNIPKKSQNFIKIWMEKLNGYEFILWNENNFDLDSAPNYVKQAYNSKKYAFVSDYVRLYALYKFGGIYLDIDVEIKKPFDELLDNEFFIGREDAVYLSTSVIGAVKGNRIIGDLLAYYKDNQFINESGKFNFTTNVELISKYLKATYDYDFVDSEQFFEGCTIYKRENFSPKNYITNRKINSINCFSVHNFDGSWENTEKGRLKSFFVSFLTKLPISCSNAIIDEYKKIKFFIKNKRIK